MISSNDFLIKLCQAMNIESSVVKEIVITVPAEGLIKIVVHMFTTQKTIDTIDWQDFVNGAYVNIYCHESE
jgi:hypothetical protein